VWEIKFFVKRIPFPGSFIIIGHHGKGRTKPVEVHETIDVYPEICPCGSKDIKRYESFDEHFVEDIEVRKKVTLFRMHHGRCNRCGRILYPKSDNSIIRNSRIGPMARSFGSFLHYIGIPYRKVKRIFKEVFDLDITHTSLMQFDKKQAENGLAIYEGMKEVVRSSSHVNIDETGWRVDGRNCWLWVFVTDKSVLYAIDESRGSKVLKNILGKRCEGIINSDFYSAYNLIEASGKQRCLSHLLNEIKKVEEKNKFPIDSKDGRFLAELKSVLKESINSWNEYKKGTISIKDLKEVRDKITSRMIEIIQMPLDSPDTNRILHRIIRHNKELFLFLDNPDVEPTNNRAERHLRPNVIMRKITFGNRSKGGAEKHQVIMSIIQTGIQNGIQPLNLFLKLTLNNTSIKDPIRIRAP
jgi:transposase